MSGEEGSTRSTAEAQQRLKAALAEYESLRAEIVSRFDAQQTLFHYTLLIAGASVPILLSAFERQQFAAFLAPPWLFAVTGALWIGHGAVINQITRYLDQRLVPGIRRLLDSLGTEVAADCPLIGYDEFMYGVLMRTPDTYIVHGVPMLLIGSFWAVPSIASLLVWHHAASAVVGPTSWLERLIFCADCVTIVGVLTAEIASGFRFIAGPFLPDWICSHPRTNAGKS